MSGLVIVVKIGTQFPSLDAALQDTDDEPDAIVNAFPAIPSADFAHCILWYQDRGDLDSYRLLARVSMASQFLAEQPHVVAIAFHQDDHKWLRSLVPAVVGNPQPFQIRLPVTFDAHGTPVDQSFHTPLLNVAIQRKRWDHVVTLVYVNVSRKIAAKPEFPGPNPQARLGALSCAAALGSERLRLYKRAVRMGKRWQRSVAQDEFAES